VGGGEAQRSSAGLDGVRTLIRWCWTEQWDVGARCRCIMRFEADGEGCWPGWWVPAGSGIDTVPLASARSGTTAHLLPVDPAPRAGSRGGAASGKPSNRS